MTDLSNSLLRIPSHRECTYFLKQSQSQLIFEMSKRGEDPQAIVFRRRTGRTEADFVSKEYLQIFQFFYLLKGLYERNFKLPSMQRWQCPIYNGTLEILIWSKMFLRLKRCLFLWGSPLVHLTKKCTCHFCRETLNETKTLITNSSLIRQRFLGYRCKLGIVIFV